MFKMPPKGEHRENWLKSPHIASSISIFPYFINPDELNWGCKVMFLFVGAELFIMAGLYFFQPETKNRSNADIDALYASQVSPSKFNDLSLVVGQVVEKAKKRGFLGQHGDKTKHVGTGVC
jgi:hypothetical protein